MNKYALCILLIIGMLIQQSLRAQTMQNLHYKPYAGAGLKGHFSATCSLEDSRGFMWFGTLGGLIKYDGYKHIDYINNLKDSNSISDNKITTIFEDNKNNLWVGTQNGLNYLNVHNNTFKRFTDTAKNGIGTDPVDFLKIAPNGTLWLKNASGWFRFDSLSQKFNPFAHRPLPKGADNINFEFIGNGLLVGTTKGLFFQKNINEDFIPITSNEFINDTLVVMQIYKETANKIWVGTTKGLYIVSNYSENFDYKVSAIALPTDFIYTIHKKTDQELWIGTNDGLVVLNTETLESQRFLNDSIAAQDFLLNEVWVQAYSKNNILWLNGKRLYVSDIKKNQFQHFRINYLDFDVGIPEIFEIYEYSPNVLLLPLKNGPHFLDLTNNKFTPFPYKPSYNLRAWKYGIICFYEEENGLLWTGNTGGLFLFDKNKNEFIDIEKQVAGIKSLHNDYIRKIHKDRQGNLWIATFFGGICKINLEATFFKRYSLPGWLNGTRTILEDHAGNIWIGTRGGLLQYLETQDSFKIYKKDPNDSTSISENTAFSLYEDNVGSIWCGTYGGGLNKLNPKTGKFRHFTQNDGLSDNNVLSIYPDQKGNLWLSTFKGLSVFNLDTETFTIYNSENGLLNDEFPSFALGRSKYSGKLFYAGPEGIDFFHPDSIKLSMHNPNIYISGLKIFNKEVKTNQDNAKSDEFTLSQDISYTSALRIPYDQNVITLDYTALDYSAPENIQYAYILSGFEKSWQYVGKQRSATFTNLDPGDYTFKVKATNADGVWGNKIAQLKITIQPPWWKTWWAYSIYGLLTMATIFEIYRFQKKRILQRERQKTQAKELEQAKEIEKAYHELKITQDQLIQSEKMASLGELTSGIAHEIKNPLNFINNFSEINIELLSEIETEQVPQIPEAVKVDLEPMIRNLKKNSEKINQHGKRIDGIVKGMLQHSRLGNVNKEVININMLCEESLKLAYHGFRSKEKSFNASYETRFEPDLPGILAIPQDIGRVLLNLINNAFYAVHQKKKQYQQDTLSGNLQIESNYQPTVIVATQRIDKKIGITVSDNGLGIPVSLIAKIFQPFFTTKPTGEGTGLGLSMAYVIITKGHGGELLVKSKEGIGTDFEIILPIIIEPSI